MASHVLQRQPRASDRILFAVTATATVIILAMLAIIVLDVLRGGANVVTWSFLSEAPSKGMTAGGIFPAIVGTVALTLMMTLAAVPAGVATAVYLTEYASPSSQLARAIRICIANLAGVPSIVFGLFGLGFFVSAIGRGIDAAFYGGHLTYGKPALIWAALTLAILTLPVVVVATEEALRAVPRELRDASLALGATRFQTVLRVVLPHALGGIMTGAILAVSRGSGESRRSCLPVIITSSPTCPHYPNDQFMNLGYHVYVLATQSPDVDRTKPLLYGTVLVLLGLTFLLNLAAIVIRARMRRSLLAIR